MPNWCENELTITGNGPDLDQFLEEVKGMPPRWTEHIVIPGVDLAPKEEEFCFNKIIPQPPDMEGQDYTKVGRDWERKNWGVKWGACDIQISRLHEGKVLISFNTPWAPADPVMDAMAAKYPSLEFFLEYWERGMAFQGRRVYYHGKLTEHRTEEYQGSRGG